MVLDFLFQLRRRLSGYWQWWWLWLISSKFMVTVAGVVFDKHGLILLQRHRHWVPDVWGLPGGIVQKAERVEEAIAREILEETGLKVENVQLVRVVSGYRLRLEFYFQAQLVENGKAPAIQLQSNEVLEARFFDPCDLPVNVLPAQRKIIEMSLK
ncbi:MAG: NUDIX domain-containing protein [Chloroflexota bacterium]